MSLLEMVHQRLSGEAVSRISSRIGADPGTTSNAIDQALPLLLAALARNSGDSAQSRALSTRRVSGSRRQHSRRCPRLRK